MSTRRRLVLDNVQLLEQGLALLEGLDDELYARPEPAVSSSGIGSHLRHVLDYYGRFLAGFAEGRLDYDERPREARIESEREFAAERVRALVDDLRAVAAGGAGAGRLAVKMDARDEDDAAPPWSTSSVERELQFLSSHTVHHYALIAVILRLNGVQPEEGFGVAPSTQRYWKESRACAP